MYTPHFEQKYVDIIEAHNTDVLVELIYNITNRVLDKTQLTYRINEAKRVLDMRKDPHHEAWMEQR